MFLSSIEGNFIKVVFIGIVTLILGCSTEPVPLKPVSGIEVPLNNKQSTDEVSGSSCQYRILSIFPINGAPATEEAVQEAISSNDGDSLHDITVFESFLPLGIISRTCINISGYSVKSRQK
jgi:hypothetical protein